VHESCYVAPLSYTSDRLHTAIEQGDGPPEKERDEEQHQPKKVQSIKSMGSHKIPIPNKKAALSMRPPTKLDASADTQSPSQGEGGVIPEHVSYTEDLANGIKALKQKAETTISDPGIRAKVLKSIKNLEESNSHVVPRGQLKIGKKKANAEVDATNIVNGKRKRVQSETQVENPRPPKKKVKERFQRLRFGLKKGDAVSAAPEIFDGDVPGSFSKDNPKRQLGTIVRVWEGRKLAQVEWVEGGSKDLCRYDQLRIEKVKVDAAMMVTVMMMEALKRPKDPLDKDGWPRDFFHALVSPDWREWVAAIKKEIASWLDFNAYTEIPFGERKPGSSIVPPGELFTR
jgi:hypothetical protein